jgi:hypothetical protein
MVRESTRQARQPFTLSGVARYAHAPALRFWAMGLLFAFLCGAVIGWSAARCWFPVIDEAVMALPITGKIEGGSFVWPEKSSRLLAANPFLSLAIHLDDTPHADTAPTDFSFEFGSRNLAVRSLFGSMYLPYPTAWTIELNRTSVLPFWGAWKAPIGFGIAVASALLLLSSWAFLALPYSAVALFVASIFKRDVDWKSSWKLAVAAQWPGSILMLFGLLLYSTGQISLLFVCVILAAHFIPTLIYVLFSPLFLERKASPTGRNPFRSEKNLRLKGPNPFRTTKDESD